MDDDSIFLSRDDVARLTGFKRRDKQIEALRMIRVKHRVNAAGEPIVAKEVVLGGRKAKEPEEYVPKALREEALRRASRGPDLPGFFGPPVS